MQEIVNVTGEVSGEVGDEPESVACENVLSEDDSSHVSTPFALQKILVRPPEGIDAGTAQMSACAGTFGARGADALVVVGVVDFFTTGAGGGEGGLYPRKVQMLSNTFADANFERKLTAHGRIAQSAVISVEASPWIESRP